MPTRLKFTVELDVEPNETSPDHLKGLITEMLSQAMDAVVATHDTDAELGTSTVTAEVLLSGRYFNDERGEGIECPHCGATEFEHIEDAQLFRRGVRGLRGGVLKIEGYYGVYDEDAKGERLGCRSCFEEFSVPEEVKQIDWK